MSTAHSIDTGREAVAEMWQGWITTQDSSRYWLRLFSDQQAVAIRRRLSKQYNAGNLLTSDELRQFARDKTAPALAGRKWCAAVVTKELPRLQFCSHYETANDLFFRVKVFMNRRAALGWLATL